MGLEAGARVDDVVVVDQQQSVMGVGTVEVVAEREGVLGVQPAEAALEPLVGAADVNGGGLALQSSWGSSRGTGWSRHQEQVGGSRLTMTGVGEFVIGSLQGMTVTRLELPYIPNLDEISTIPVTIDQGTTETQFSRRRSSHEAPAAGSSS
jgi:hypothetical protein